MSNAIQKAGKVRHALERLDEIEKGNDVFRKDLQGIADYVNNERQETAARFGSFAEAMEAIIGLLGKDAIEAEMVKRRAERDAASVLTLKQRIEEGVTAGAIEVAQEIGETSFITFTETLADGTVARPGLSSAPVSKFEESVRTALKGAKVGTKVPGVKGSVVEVAGIFNPVSQVIRTPSPEAVQPEAA